MEFHVAPGSRGLKWFQGGVRMLDRNPRGLIAVTLLLVLLEQLPSLLASLPELSIALSVLLLLLGPALLAGLLHAIAEADAGRPVSLMQLFEGLHRPGVRAQLIVLGMMALLTAMLVGLVVQRILGPDNIKVIVQIASKELELKPDSEQAQALAMPLLKALAAALAILFVLMAGLFFAVPRVMFDGRKALGAMAESIAACAANVLSLTLYGLVFGAVVFVAFLGLAIIAAVLGLLGQAGLLLLDLIVIVVMVIGLLVNTSGNYLAWREVFGHGSAGVPPPQAGIIV